MRLENINNTSIFRPGDYELVLNWSRAQDALDVFLLIAAILQTADPSMTITQYQRETLESFVWNKGNAQNAISECVTEFLRLRGDDRRLKRPMMVFRTSIEGVDLLFVLQIREQASPLIRVVTLDFETEHIDPVGGVFSSASLQDLFTKSVLNCAPDYSVLRRLPPINADWYEETRISIDTEKVPVTIEWLNFFSWEWVERIGEKKFDHCPVGEVKRLPNGFLYTLQNEPFVYEGTQQTPKQLQANKHFGLEKLHKKYAS